MPLLRRATGPGRVNLIGDHTDYNDGLALPMAIDRGVTVEWTPTEDGSGSGRRTWRVTSSAFDGTVELPVRPGPGFDPREVEPPWARLVAAMVVLVGPATGGTLRLDSTLPVGSGLASSAATSVALAEAFGAGGTPMAIASLCQEAEHRCGIPVGAMDPLVCAAGLEGHALLIDFADMSWQPVRVPVGAEVLVVDSGDARTLRESAYADRVEECRVAAGVIGRPLGLAHPSELAAVEDPLTRRRARHVITECGRVRQMIEAFAADDLDAAGALMTESHRSLAADFEVSTPGIEALVDRLLSVPGVVGARLTGAGFGGCVVVLSRPGALDPDALGAPAWRVVASDGTVARRSGTTP